MTSDEELADVAKGRWGGWRYWLIAIPVVAILAMLIIRALVSLF